MSDGSLKEWYVFRQHGTRFGYGTRETAERFLRFLNRHRAVNHYQMARLDEIFPTQSIADVEQSPNRVDMEKDMDGWRG